MEARQDVDVDVAAHAATEFNDLVDTWLVRLSPPRERTRRVPAIPSNFQGHLLAVLAAANASFAVAIRCVQNAPLIGLMTSYRFLAESLVIARWLTEREETTEREERASALTAASLKRLTKIADEARGEPSFRHLSSTIDELTQHLEARRTSIPPPGKSVPRRPELMRRLLPGGYAIFSAMSEFASHPGALTVIFLADRDDGSDRVFWLSVAFATVASIAGEVAIGLGRDDLIDELDRMIDSADPIIAVAWPPELHPNGQG